MSAHPDPGAGAAARRKGRTADPWRDLAVIDERAPRTNQAIVGVLSAVAVATGWWPLLALLALQLTVGLTLGRRFCLPCLLYFEVIQPRLGEGRLEDSRPPRFANLVGAAFLWSASLAWAAGLSRLGAVLGGVVAALALLAATTGLCVGCVLYRVAARLRGVHALRIHAIDLAALGAPVGEPRVVLFSHPLCADCRTLGDRLARDGLAPVVVDVSLRRDLARAYGIAVVPLAFEVGADGRVLREIRG